MKNELIFYPYDTLRQKAMPVQKFDEALFRLLRDMEESLREKKGVGIAAPQVNAALSCFLVYFDNTIHTFINPVITEYSLASDFYEEGCLSVPGVYADVERSIGIKVRAQDRRARQFSLEVEGFFARIIQHEYDHLNGVLFFDYLSRGARRRLLKSYEKLSGILGKTPTTEKPIAESKKETANTAVEKPVTQHK